MCYYLHVVAVHTNHSVGLCVVLTIGYLIAVTVCVSVTVVGDGRVAGGQGTMLLSICIGQGSGMVLGISDRCNVLLCVCDRCGLGVGGG